MILFTFSWAIIYLNKMLVSLTNCLLCLKPTNLIKYSNLQCCVQAEARLVLVLARAFGKKAQLGSACHAFQKPRLGSPYFAKKAWFSLAFSYHLKK